MADVEQPEIRAYDEGGNVRPADDRHLSAKDKKRRDDYVAKAAKAAVEGGKR